MRELTCYTFCGEIVNFAGEIESTWNAGRDCGRTNAFVFP